MKTQDSAIIMYLPVYYNMFPKQVSRCFLEESCALFLCNLQQIPDIIKDSAKSVFRFIQFLCTLSTFHTALSTAKPVSRFGAD